MSDPTDFSSTVYAIVKMSSSALDALVTATFPEALQLFGPAPPPPGGWMEYVVQNAFGGVMPGPMDASFPILVNMLTTRAATTTDAFQEALFLAGSCNG